MEVKMEKEFEFNNVKYIARILVNNHGEILYKNNKTRPKNMKDIVRQYLKKNNVEISTDAKIITTHGAVRKLFEYI